MKKVCRTCNVEKELGDYYKHPEMRDGHLNICAKCTRSRVKKYSENNEEKIRAYEAVRSKTPERIKRGVANAKLWRARNPIAYKAQTAVGNAIRDGKLTKKPCRFCGSTKNIHGHHKDYVGFLDVVWLCARCHHRLHHDIPKAEGDNKSYK